MPRHLLTLNAGSSSLKFALFEHDRERGPRALLAGQVEGFGTHPRLTATSTTGERLVERSWAHDEAGAPDGVHAALGVVLDWLQSHAAPLAVRAVGHRVVHGGVHYAAPVLLDEAVDARLDRLVPLAPLHQPHNLEAVRAARHHFPGTPQVACFDTGFHRGHPFVQDTFALPRAYYDEGVRRYGFHGLSYEYIALRLAELDPSRGRGRVIVAHLGSGASMCALRDGRSVSSSMGFTALDGLPMGTRPGQIDPGVLLWLMTEKGMDAAAISELLYRRSGLKGLSGISNDMRDLRASDAPEARDAIAYFVERLRRETGALAAVLGGLDALVFTAGIGENDAALRAATADGLQFLGVRLDAAANASHGRDTGGLVSPPDAAVAVWVIPTNEELMIARHTARLAGFETR